MDTCTLLLSRRAGAAVASLAAAAALVLPALAQDAAPARAAAWQSAALLLPAEPVRPSPRVLVPVERRASDPNTQEFHRADADRDRMLSRGEAERVPGLADRFDEVDANKDGFISPEEFARAMTV